MTVQRIKVFNYHISFCLDLNLRTWRASWRSRCGCATHTGTLTPSPLTPGTKRAWGSSSSPPSTRRTSSMWWTRRGDGSRCPSWSGFSRQTLSGSGRGRQGWRISQKLYRLYACFLNSWIYFKNQGSNKNHINPRSWLLLSPTFRFAWNADQGATAQTFFRQFSNIYKNYCI